MAVTFDREPRLCLDYVAAATFFPMKEVQYFCTAHMVCGGIYKVRFKQQKHKDQGMIVALVMCLKC